MSQPGLKATWLGRPRIDLATCTSTSDEAMRLARAGASHGTIVVADIQTQGRGRLGRSWWSPPGNLYLSVILRCAEPPAAPAVALGLSPAQVPPITLAIGIAVCDAIRAFGAAAQLKWPNDVIIAEQGEVHKIAGVLVETQSQGPRLDHLIVGIGVNLVGHLPDELATRATSLRALVGRYVDRDQLLAQLLPRLETWLGRYASGGVAAVAEDWNQRMCRSVQVRAGDGPAVQPLGVADDGALEVLDDRGGRQRIVSGEVTAQPATP
jgi:BirA family biotin operon repressor/biotin-[acetyl-CoA-carboxylase] ligase